MSKKRTAEYRARKRLERIMETGFKKIRCMSCGEKDIRHLEIHHIKGRYVKNADNINNLALLCSNCHSLITHGYAKIKNGKFIEENSPKTELLLQRVRSEQQRKLEEKDKEIEDLKLEIYNLRHPETPNRTKEGKIKYTAKDFINKQVYINRKGKKMI